MRSTQLDGQAAQESRTSERRVYLTDVDQPINPTTCFALEVQRTFFTATSSLIVCLPRYSIGWCD